MVMDGHRIFRLRVGDLAETVHCGCLRLRQALWRGSWWAVHKTV